MIIFDCGFHSTLRSRSQKKTGGEECSAVWKNVSLIRAEGKQINYTASHAKYTLCVLHIRREEKLTPVALANKHAVLISK